MTTTITKDQTIELLKEIADERPDFVYERVPYSEDELGLLDPDLDPSGRCLYTDRDGEPSCIVGVFLDRLDIPRPDFSSIHNGMQAWELIGRLEGEDYYFEERAKTALVEVQGLQDLGTPWGEAVERAISTIQQVERILGG